MVRRAAVRRGTRSRDGARLTRSRPHGVSRGRPLAHPRAVAQAGRATRPAAEPRAERGSARSRCRSDRVAGGEGNPRRGHVDAHRALRVGRAGSAWDGPTWRRRGRRAAQSHPGRAGLCGSGCRRRDAAQIHVLRTEGAEWFSPEAIVASHGRTVGRLDGQYWRSYVFLAGPLYEDLELWYPKIRLEEEGATTVVAGIGEKTYQGKRGYPVTVDSQVDQIESADFDGLVIPGGFAPDQLRRFDKVLQLTRQIYHGRKPVAFICHAGWVPISAKILKGKRATSVRAIKDDMENAGVIWEDAPVVVDGNLISSRTPADLPAFCKALIAALRKGPVD